MIPAVLFVSALAALGLLAYVLSFLEFRASFIHETLDLRAGNPGVYEAGE